MRGSSGDPVEHFAHHVGWHVRERQVYETLVLNGRVECLRRSHSDLVASRLAGASNRDQRPEVPGTGCRREENPHERMLSQMPVDGSFTPHDGGSDTCQPFVDPGSLRHPPEKLPRRPQAARSPLPELVIIAERHAGP